METDRRHANTDKTRPDRLMEDAAIEKEGAGEGGGGAGEEKEGVSSLQDF